MASEETLSAEIVDGPNRDTLVNDAGKRGGVFFKIKVGAKSQRIYIRASRAYSHDNGVWDLWGACVLAPAKIWFPFKKLEYNAFLKKGEITISTVHVEKHSCGHLVYKGISSCMICGAKEGALAR
jgi:hypothetical protein